MSLDAEERGFVLALKKDPTDATARGAYADWLDEHGRHYDAVLQREAAGLSELRFKVRRKSGGPFSEARRDNTGERSRG
ncbi:MAG: TIGR02996 domain-containing protein, partial [Planctomycetes bacterium]|nr:TIGR02996 domain-containing protein [Planctomycetota bacterium]